MATGTLTLNPITLPEPANAVYLLADASLDPDIAVAYEATLDGTTWVPVASNEITSLGHAGMTMQVRATLSGTSGTGTIYWFVACATTV